MANRAVLVSHNLAAFNRVDGLKTEDWYLFKPGYISRPHIYCIRFYGTMRLLKQVGILALTGAIVLVGAEVGANLEGLK